MLRNLAHPDLIDAQLLTPSVQQLCFNFQIPWQAYLPYQLGSCGQHRFHFKRKDERSSGPANINGWITGNLATVVCP